MSREKGYEIYIDGLKVPITPQTITYAKNSNVEVITLVNDAKFTLHHMPDPDTISFSIRVPVDPKDPFSLIHEDGERDVEVWRKLFEKELLDEGKKVELVIGRGKTSKNLSSTVYKEVLLTGYSTAEDEAEGDDFIFELEFTVYVGQRNQELTMNLSHHLINLEYARGWNR